MMNFRLKLAAILLDSNLNTRKACSYSKHDSKEEKNSNDVVIVESPAKRGKFLKTSHQTEDQSSLYVLPIAIIPTNASELVGELCKFIMSIDHAETLEYVYLIPYNMYCLYTLF